MTGSNVARAVRLDTWRTKVRLAAGVTVCTALVVGLVVAAVRADRTGPTVAACVAAVLATLLLGFVVGGGTQAVRRRALVVSDGGIGYESTRRPWQVAWRELSQARVEYGWRPTSPSAWIAKNWSVRLVLVPANPEAFARNHPELEVFRGRFATEGYGFPLGPARELIEPLRAGLEAFGGTANGGVRALGRIRRGALL
jgi:hypothetical protein